MAYKFKIGSTVRLKRRPPSHTGTQVYEVVRLLPPDADDVPAYRIRDASGRERAVRETEIDKG